MTNPELPKSIQELRDSLHSGHLTCQEIIEVALARISASHTRLNCFVDVFDTRSRARAVQLDRDIADGRRPGALHGVPIAIKDIFDFPGHHASGGSLLARTPSHQHATVVARLEAAGAIIVGTLNLDELAAGGTGENLRFGRCCNPWDTNRITGGSSSGSAAAVAAGLVMATIGSDAGGSIRLPAAYCGVVGLKPSYGRVSRHGAMARTWSMDCIGPMARNVEDVCSIQQVIEGEDPLDPSSVDCAPTEFSTRHGRVVGVFTDEHCDQPEHFIRAIDTFSSIGYSTKPTLLSALDRLTSLHQIIVKSEAAAMHGNAVRSGDSRMSHAVRSVIQDGLEIPAVQYIEALSLRQTHLKSFIDEVFTEIDVLAMPVSIGTAPVYAPQDALSASEVDREFSQLATLTRFANYLGIPGLTVPTGIDNAGLPTALQLIGKPYMESTLMSVARDYEHRRGSLVYPGI